MRLSCVTEDSATLIGVDNIILESGCSTTICRGTTGFYHDKLDLHPQAVALQWILSNKGKAMANGLKCKTITVKFYKIYNHTI